MQYVHRYDSACYIYCNIKYSISGCYTAVVTAKRTYGVPFYARVCSAWLVIAHLKGSEVIVFILRTALLTIDSVMFALYHQLRYVSTAATNGFAIT
jgi:hypothetical protein